MDDPMNTRQPTLDQRARNRFLVINVIRVGGVAMILFAILILQGVVPLPEIAGYVVLVLGLGEAFVVPQLLARAWRSPDRGDLEGPPRD